MPLTRTRRNSSRGAWSAFESATRWRSWSVYWRPCPLSGRASTQATAPSTSTTVAVLMQELGLEEFATPLGRPSDNDALAGSRNGSVTRKQFSYGYFLGRYMKRLDQSYCDILPLLLNHQSSCHLLLWKGDATGMQPTANRQAEIFTPYGWLSSLMEAEH